MKTILVISVILIALACQSPSPVTGEIVDPQPTQILSVQVDGHSFTTPSAVAIVSITDSAFVQITAADVDGLVAYRITQDNFPEGAFTSYTSSEPQENLIAHAVFFADTTQGHIGAVKPGDVVIQHIAFQDTKGFTKTYDIQIYIVL